MPEDEYPGDRIERLIGSMAGLGAYRLEGHTPVPVDDIEEMQWARVRHTRVGPYRVSTIFMGLDRNHLRNGPPILFETMTFCNVEPVDPIHPGAEIDNPCDGRCCTWEEAEAIHREAIEWLRVNMCEPNDTMEELPYERTTMKGSSPEEPPPEES